MNGVHHPYTREKFNNLSLAKKVEILKFRKAVNSAIKNIHINEAFRQLAYKKCTELL